VNARKAVPWVVGTLVVLGLACVGARVHLRRQTGLVAGDSLWRISYTVEFQARKPGARLRLGIPSDTPHARVFRQNLFHSGLAPVRSRPSRAGNREADLTAIRAGACSASARFDVHLSPRPLWRPIIPPLAISPEDRAAWLRGTKTIQAEDGRVAAVLAPLRRDGWRPADLVPRLFDYCLSEIALDAEGPRDAAGVLEAKRGAAVGRTRAFVALCRAAKTPARLVVGFNLQPRDKGEPRVWAEVLTDHDWEPYDLVDGHARQLPHTFVPVWRDGDEVVRVWDGHSLRTTFVLFRLPPSPGMFRSEVRASPLEILDLTRLPLEMHRALAVILLLPFGALVTAVFRTVIGVRTFGTFTPSLVALSFVYSDWRAGVFVFALAIGLGLASRAALERLKLLLVPRLSLLLTLIVWCIVFSVSLLDYFQLIPSTQAVLLPMVILTMTVERFHVTSEEDGLRFAIQLMAGTVLVAACCYAVLRWDAVGDLLLVFPELHLFTIAALVLLGRYTGYRLTELRRFRDLRNPTEQDTANERRGVSPHGEANHQP